jgi:hypothetical protein
MLKNETDYEVRRFKVPEEAGTKKKAETRKIAELALSA